MENQFVQLRLTDLENASNQGQKRESTQKDTVEPARTVPRKETKQENGAIIQLRSEPITVSNKEFRNVFGLDENSRPLEYIQNDFEDRGEVVIDHVTGLTWQKSGSDEYLIYDDAEKYIEELKRKHFAGYDDWRLPTIPELMSLLEPEKQLNGLYIHPIFDRPKEYLWYWSADRRT